MKNQAALLCLIMLSPVAGLAQEQKTTLPETTPATMQETMQETEVRIHVTGIKKKKGQITCSLYNDPATFLKKGKDSLRKVIEPPAREGVTCLFTGVAPGDYAITVSHDKNANNRMDNNFLGIPSEPWGVPNNARPSFRAPRWSEAVFTVAGQPVEMTVKID